MDAVHHTVDSAMRIMSTVLDVYLLYIIKNHSAHKILVYQVLLSIDAFLDLSASVLELFGQQVSTTAFVRGRRQEGLKGYGVYFAARTGPESVPCRFFLRNVIRSDEV